MSETNNGTKIILTQEDAKIYNAFRENREKFIALLEAGVFDLDSGKAEVNMHNGQVQSVHIHRMTYKRTVDMLK